jgi:uncharacterized protein
MTPELFVDTSAWYPLADPAHPDHERLAKALRARVMGGARIVTTNLVVAESYVLLLRRTGRTSALSFLREIMSEPIVVAHSTPELEDRARVDWVEGYADQDFSFADAVSFAVMSAREIREALTLDGHFAAAGFAMVPGG